MQTTLKPYLEIAASLRERLLRGELEPNQKLDSQNALAVEYGVSPATVQKSLKELEREGLIYAEQGKGRFVAEPRVRRKSWTVGVLLFELEHLVHPVIRERLAGVKDVLGPAGYHLATFAMNGVTHARRPDDDADWLAALASIGLDGAIVIAQEPDLRTIRRLAHDVPSVWMDAPFVEEHLVSVSLDYLGGGFAAARHLLELGHRRIGFLGPCGDVYRVAQQQMQGMRLAVDQLGRRGVHQLIHLCTAGYREEEAAARVAALAADPARPTALVCASDELAIGAWSGAASAGLAIPRELSLIGWNDTIRPERVPLPLTTVRMDFRRAGAVSARLLLRLIADPAAIVHEERLSADLVVRDSTQPLIGSCS